MKCQKFSIHDVEEITNILRNDGIISIATDTVMGLAIVADSNIAKEKLIKVKNRPENKHFPVMVSDGDMLRSITKMDDRVETLVDEFFPGKITFVLNQKHDSNLVLDIDTVAVRIPDDDVIRNIVRRLNKPIFLTSANKSGEPTMTTYAEVLEIFEDEIDGIVLKDASGFKPSTIVDLSQDDIKVLREGDIHLDEVLSKLKETI